MSNGTIDQPILIVHPTPPSTNRVLRYLFNNGSEVVPYYMLSDGIPKPIKPIADHLLLSNIGSNSHSQIDSFILENSGVFRWVLQAGHSNLPSTGTDTGFAYGHNSANDGITAISDGIIEGMSVRIEPTRTSGKATYLIAINNVFNNAVGQRIVIDGNVGIEGELNNNSGLIKFAIPFPYVAGDQIEIRAITVGWAPTSSDSTVILRMKENI